MNQNQNQNQTQNPYQNRSQNRNPYSSTSQNRNPYSSASQNPYQNQAAPDDLLNTPALDSIDPAKLQMLSSLARQAQNKSPNELMSFLMSASAQSGSGGLSFNPSEMDSIIQVLKTGRSPQEVQRIDRICSLLKTIRK